MVKVKKVISWGRGLQSTVMAVMSALGHLPKVDAVIASDTHWERAATYEVSDFYKKWLEDRGVPVYIIDGGDVRAEGVERSVCVPFWTKNGGPLRRSCTKHFKIEPVRRAIRDIFNLPYIPKPGAIETWLGFTLDEWGRMKHSRVKFIKNVFPLIYTARVDRGDCIAYLEDLGLPVPVKSACIGCPYRKASEFLELPDFELSEAVSFDDKNRHNPLVSDGSTAKEIYVYHHGPVALRAADLEADAARERAMLPGYQLPLLCGEGMCHV